MKNAHTMTTEMAVALIAVVLMLAGAVMLIADVTPGLAFAIITVGIAITVILQRDKRRRHGPAH